MGYFHLRLDAAADVEVTFDFQEAGIEQRDEVIRDPVRHCLVERALIAEGPQVQLQRLELDARFIGNVADADRGEVRLPRHRAETGELGRLEEDLVVALRIRVGERLQLF